MDGKLVSTEINLTMDEGNDKQVIYETKTKLQSFNKINTPNVIKKCSTTIKTVSHYIKYTNTIHFKKYDISTSTYLLPQNRIKPGDKQFYIRNFEKILITYKSSKVVKKLHYYEEIIEKLPRMYHYYQNYVKYFCNPIFLDYKMGKLIKKYKEEKAQIYYNKQYSDNAKKNEFILKQEKNQTDNASGKIKFFNSTVNNKLNEKSSSNSLIDSGSGFDFIENDDKLLIKDDKTGFGDYSNNSKISGKISRNSMKENAKFFIECIEGKKQEKDSSKGSREKSQEFYQNMSIEENKHCERHAERHLTISYNLTTSEKTHKDQKEVITLDSDNNQNIYKTISITEESQKSNKLKNIIINNEKLEKRPTKRKYNKPNFNLPKNALYTSKVISNSIDKKNNIIKRNSSVKKKENKKKGKSTFNIKTRNNQLNIEDKNKEIKDITIKEEKIKEITVKEVNAISSSKKQDLLYFNKVIYQKQPFNIKNVQNVKKNIRKIKTQSKQSYQYSQLDSHNKTLEENENLNQVIQEKEEEKEKVKRPKSNSLSRVIDSRT